MDSAAQGVSHAFEVRITKSPLSQSFTGRRRISYGYDGLARLTEATYSTGEAHSYAYDLVGNRTEAWENGVQAQSRGYNAANQVVGWSYDAAGNLLSDGTTTSTYDALSRLTSQAGTSYAYNGDGTLVAQTASGITTRYAQDLVAPLSQVLNDGSASYVYGNGVERLRALNGSWYLGDALGSVRGTMNDASAMLATASYDPWGVPQEGLIAPFGFTGELQNLQGMVHLRARWYDTGEGRFQVRDPFKGIPVHPYTNHPYQYAYSNPNIFSDPSGQLAVFIHGGYTRVDPAKGSTFEYELARWLGLPEEDLILTGPGGQTPPTDIAASVSDQQRGIDELASKIINYYDEYCGSKPIMMFGNSRGGGTAQLIAAKVFTMRPDVSIDLVITVAPVISFDHPPSAGPSVHAKMPNVKMHVSYRSWQGVAVYDSSEPKKWPVPIGSDALGLQVPELDIAGAYGGVVKGTSHISMSGFEMYTFKRVNVQGDANPLVPGTSSVYVLDQTIAPNPIWQSTKLLVDVLYRK